MHLSIGHDWLVLNSGKNYQERRLHRLEPGCGQVQLLIPPNHIVQGGSLAELRSQTGDQLGRLGVVLMFG